MGVRGLEGGRERERLVVRHLECDKERYRRLERDIYSILGP